MPWESIKEYNPSLGNPSESWGGGHGEELKRVGRPGGKSMGRGLGNAEQFSRAWKNKKGKTVGND